MSENVTDLTERELAFMRTYRELTGANEAAARSVFMFVELGLGADRPDENETGIAVRRTEETAGERSLLPGGNATRWLNNTVTNPLPA